EAEPVGGFVGDSVAVPAFEGRTLITSIAFMMVQDPILGLAAMALYPVQMYVIPKLQRQVNALSKQRVRTVRKLSERIGEIVTGIEEVHANGTAEWERANISDWLGKIYWIRYDIYRKKFFIKFLNTFLGQLTPFFFYSIGGYLVIKGDLTIGALVAVLAAYKDMSDPWKELLAWYQQKEDTRVKYDQIVDQVHPGGLLGEAVQAAGEGDVPHLSGPVVATNVSVEEEGGIKILDGVSFQFELSDKVALIGESGSGAGSVAKVLARLVAPTAGSIRFGDANLATLPQAVTGRRIGYVGQSVALFNGTIRDNLIYGLRHRPVQPPAYDEAARAEWERFVVEAEAAGNSLSDPAAEWIDRASLGASSEDGFNQHIIQVLSVVELDDEVMSFGLQGVMQPLEHPGLAHRILEARQVLRARLTEPQYQHLVEPFDREAYNANMSVAENILFGTPVGPAFDLAHIAENAYMLSVLEKVGLKDRFLENGVAAARIMVVLFQELASDHQFFERFSFISGADLPAFEAALRRVDGAGGVVAESADRALFRALPFKLIPERHRLGLFNPELEAKLLEARDAFADGLPKHYQDAVAFFNPAQYNPPASVLDNILFGKPNLERPRARERITALVGEVVDQLGLRATLIDLGLNFEIGIGGGRLSPAQRQKLAIARALLKQPDLMIVDQATAALDPSGRAAMRRNLIAAGERSGLLWVLPDLADAEGFGHVIIMDSGRVAEQGPLATVLGKEEPSQAAG
ncbi:MAG: ATP-binding cassette domain-containing protein, partial [Rhodospirillales bacterium]